jgi:hypothetical protein
VAVEGVDIVHEVLSVKGTVEEEKIGGIYGRWPMIVVRDSLERNGFGGRIRQGSKWRCKIEGTRRLTDTK